MIHVLINHASLRGPNPDDDPFNGSDKSQASYKSLSLNLIYFLRVSESGGSFMKECTINKHVLWK